MVEKNRKGLRWEVSGDSASRSCWLYPHPPPLHLPQAWLLESSSILMLCGVTDAGPLSQHLPSRGHTSPKRTHSFPSPAVKKCPWYWKGAGV